MATTADSATVALTIGDEHHHDGSAKTDVKLRKRAPAWVRTLRLVVLIAVFAGFCVAEAHWSGLALDQSDQMISDLGQGPGLFTFYKRVRL